MGQWARIVALLGLLLAGMPVAWASVGVQDSDGTYLCEATVLRGASSCADGQSARLPQKRVPFHPADFIGVDTNGRNPTQLTANTSPAITVKASQKSIAIRWTDNETSPAQVTFRVPDDYSTGGAFRVVVGRTETGDPPSLDFEVYVHTDETAFDAAATNQTAKELGTDIGLGSPEVITLTVATDFASLTAGQIVTFNIWRDNTDTSTSDLELYYAEFDYN